MEPRVDLKKYYHTKGGIYHTPGFDPCLPYQIDELDHAASLINAPDDRRWLCINQSRCAARILEMSLRFPPKPKSAARKEIEEVQRTVKWLSAAIKNMSVGAKLIYAENARLKGDLDQDPFLAIHFFGDVQDDFLEWTDGAVELAHQQGIGGAPRKNDALRQFKDKTMRAYSNATGSNKDFWRFFKAVTEPLNRIGLERDLTTADCQHWYNSWDQKTRERRNVTGKTLEK